MSFFEDASLVLIPSAQKLSKIYSVKPTDGTGDLAFTRSNDTATRVASNGLIEKVRTNHILQSNTFNVTWSPTSLTITSGATDPNGGTTAWTAAAAGGGAGIIQQAVTLTGLRSGSIYAKQGTHRYLYAGVYGGTTAYNTFDLQDGVIASGTTGRIESVGNGWYRCTMFGADGTTGGIQIFPTDTIGAPSTAGGNILIWRCQLETGDIATDYIATTTAAVSVGPVANVPRLDYLGSSCPRLILEGQRTNLVTYSEQFDNAAWGGGGTTITANQAVSPDGYTNADLAVNAASSNYIYQGIVGSISGTFTASIFAKKGTQSSFAFGMVSAAFGNGMGVKFNFDTQTFSTPTNYANFTSISASYQSYGNGWYRLNLTGTTATSTAYFFVLGSLLESFAVNAYVYGAQLEAAAYATSYVGPTLGASVTRGADAASKTGISSLIGQTEGTIYWEGKIDGFSANNEALPVSLFATGADINGAQIYIVLLLNRSIRFVVYDGTNIQASVITSDGFYTFGTTIKVAAVYKANDFALYINGVQIGTDTSGSVVACSELSFDYQTYVGKYSTDQALLFTTRLTNAQLAELTTI